VKKFWYIIYNTIGIPAIWLFFNIYSVFNSKVKEGLKGRRDLFSELDKSLSSFSPKKNVIIHSSSLGEYQQALPLVQEFIKKNYNVVLSFFSPSGYNNSKIKNENIELPVLNKVHGLRKSDEYVTIDTDENTLVESLIGKVQEITVDENLKRYSS